MPVRICFHPAVLLNVVSADRNCYNVGGCKERFIYFLLKENTFGYMTMITRTLSEYNTSFYLQQVHFIRIWCSIK